MVTEVSLLTSYSKGWLQKADFVIFPCVLLKTFLYRKALLSQIDKKKKKISFWRKRLWKGQALLIFSFLICDVFKLPLPWGNNKGVV